MSQQQFRFLDLPCDIRRMVYELVPEPVLQPLISKEHGIYYEDARAPTALLVTNKLIHREIQSWIDTDTRLEISVTVVICPKGRSTVIRTISTIYMIDAVRTYDEFLKRDVPSRALHYTSSIYGEVPFRNYMLAECKWREKHSVRTVPTPKDEESVRQFIRLTTLKLRHGQSVEFRYLAHRPLDQRADSFFRSLREAATSWTHVAKLSFVHTKALTSSVAVISRDAKAEEPLQLNMRPVDPNGKDPGFPACELPLMLPTKGELELLEDIDRAQE
jgi:hypothetical protein